MLVKPDYICKNIYNIPLEELKNNGIKGLIMDLDSTVMVSKSGKFSQKTLDWFEKTKKDFSLAIATNNTKPDYVQKVRNAIKCGDTGVELNGIKRLDKCQWKNAPKRVRTVSRTYGGVLSAEAVRHRILRAFFNEELKCIKKETVYQFLFSNLCIYRFI